MGRGVPSRHTNISGERRLRKMGRVTTDDVASPKRHTVVAYMRFGGVCVDAYRDLTFSSHEASYATR